MKAAGHLLSLLFTLVNLSLLQAQTFSDVSVSNGIVTGYGTTGFYGGGASFVDFNNDGWDDLVFASQDGDSLNFYQNDGAGLLAKITTPDSLTNCQSKQTLWADYDNDGDKDVFITCHGGQNRLYRNDTGTGALIFTDITTAAGIPIENGNTMGASFGDYDLDGWLDLYVCDYTLSGSTYINHLLKNNAGVFADVTAAAGLSLTPDFSFQATFLDYNNDGLPDLYVAVDKLDNNLLYSNNGDGTFSDISISSGAGIVIDAMNSGVGDIDNDGDLDLYVTNGPVANGFVGNALLINNGDSTFTESASTCGVSFDGYCWGGNFFDCDNDTQLDLYVSSEFIPSGANHKVFMNNSSCNFSTTNVFTDGGYANAYGDFNQDGKLDVALNQTEGNNYRLLQNVSSNTDNWIQIDLEGTISNKDGIGSWVEVWINGNQQVRYTTAGTGYLNQNSKTKHFGLGTATAIDSIIVRWPAGPIDKLLPIDIAGINQKLPTIIEGSYGGSLPLELLDFTARLADGPTVHLNWLTASEIDVQGFEIQRSIDGNHYERIGWLDAQLNQSGSGDYHFIDERTNGALELYYRIKMLDTDGHFEWSPVRVLELPNATSDLLAATFPNPVVSDLYLQYYSTNKKSSTLRIYNMQGSLLMHTQLQFEKGWNKEKINLSDLVSGTYILSIQNEENVQTTRFVKIE